METLILLHPVSLSSSSLAVPLLLQWKRRANPPSPMHSSSLFSRRLRRIRTKPSIALPFRTMNPSEIGPRRLRRPPSVPGAPPPNPLLLRESQPTNHSSSMMDFLLRAFSSSPQVRGEFLYGEGQVMDSSSRPCMLRFKSSPIRYLETFFKSGYLLAGYSLESQTFSLEMTGFTEGTEPTACIRVSLEQRAEYKASAGIPEIYAASLRLQSELPLYI